MKISIIIPVYNVEAYIEECLKSIMNQSFSDYECFIVDDCGKDNSMEVAKSTVSEYTGPAKFEIIESEKNGGISCARNKALKRASGEYLMFVDSDDKLCPNALDLLVSMADKYPDVDIVQGSIQCDERSDYWNITGKFPEYSSNREWIREQLLLWLIPVSVWGKLYRRELVVSNNITFSEGFMHEDIAWLFNIQRFVSSIAFVEDFCYFYRTDNNNSIMRNATRDRTHSLLSYLEIYKNASVLADTLLEKKFVFNLLTPMKVANMRNNSRYVDSVNAKLNDIYSFLSASSVDRVFLRQLKLFKLPSYLVNNPIFEKLYFLWSKKEGLV